MPDLGFTNSCTCGFVDQTPDRPRIYCPDCKRRTKKDKPLTSWMTEPPEFPLFPGGE